MKFFSSRPPKPRAPAHFLQAALLGLAITATGLVSETAQASDRQHTVRPGQNLVTIAKHHGVTVWSLAAANRLKPDEAVRAGQVLAVPEKGVVYVNDGQTLWSVARHHGCTVDALARENGLGQGSSLRPGMRLVLPGQKASAKSAGGERSWGSPKRAGQVQLVRVATNHRITLTLTDTRGRVRKEASTQLARFLKPRNSNKTKAPDRRLIGLLARVSDHFGGRTIHVVSGYRVAGGYTQHESRHVQGAAIDLRVDGVPNRALRDYLRHFDDVGVGFYPNSSFIHFDVRSQNAYWVDVSGPGQKPQYLARSERDGFDQQVTRTAGLAAVGEVVEAALEEMEHDEPSEADSDDE